MNDTPEHAAVIARRLKAPKVRCVDCSGPVVEPDDPRQDPICERCRADAVVWTDVKQ